MEFLTPTYIIPAYLITIVIASFVFTFLAGQANQYITDGSKLLIAFLSCVWPAILVLFIMMLICEFICWVYQSAYNLGERNR